MLNRERSLRIRAFVERSGRKYKRISVCAATAISILLSIAASVIELSNSCAFLATCAFAKNKGNNGNGKANGHDKVKSGGNGNGNSNGNGSGDGGGDTENGGGGGQGVVNDFQDEGFAQRRGARIESPPKRSEPDVVGHAPRENRLHDGLGFKDKLDLKFLKKGAAGDVEEYMKLLDRGGGDKGLSTLGGGHAPEKSHARELDPHEDLGFGDKLNAKSMKKELDAEEYARQLNAGPSSKGGQPAEEDSRLQERRDADSLEKSDKKEEQALKAQGKGEAKEEKKEAKEERKEAKAAAKAAKKAEKGQAASTALAAEPSVQSAEADVAQRRTGGIEIPPARAGSYASREVLAVGLTPSGSERVRALGLQISPSAIEYGKTTVRTLFVPERIDSLEALRMLRRELPGESLHLNRLYRPYYPSKNDEIEKEQRPDPDPGDRDCLGDKCYSRAAIHWKDSLTKCTPNISIGVIDTDIDLKHPTFAGRRITQKTFLPEGRQGAPNWHGTGILALLAGRPDSGTPGLIPEAKFFVANSFFADENGEAITDTISLLRSLEWMAASGAKVVNMSFAGPDDVLVQGRIKTMRTEGFVFAAAAGNEGPAAAPNYPAAYPEVVAVTAVTKDLRIYPSANRGAYIDLAAPGVRIWTALPNGRQGYRTGTSFAAPFATAVLALQRPVIMSEPEDELLDKLNTIPLGPGERNPIYGRGLVQAPSECPGSDAVASDKTVPAPRPSRMPARVEVEE
jgi:hypothetical protein